MNPLAIAGLVAGLGFLGKWAGRGFKGSPFESDYQYYLKHLPDLMSSMGLKVRTPEDYRRSLDIVYGSQRASTEATASQRALATGLGGAHTEAIVSKAVQPIDVARLGAEVEILEAADKSLLQAISLALQSLGGMGTESPFEFALGLGGGALGLALDIALGQRYIGLIEEYLRGKNVNLEDLIPKQPLEFKLGPI